LKSVRSTRRCRFARRLPTASTGPSRISRPRRVDDLRLAAATRRSSGLQEADGLKLQLASSHGSDFNFDFRALETRIRSAPCSRTEPRRRSRRSHPTAATEEPRGFCRGAGPDPFALSDGDVYMTYATTARGPRAADGLLRHPRSGRRWDGNEGDPQNSGSGVTTSTWPRSSSQRNPTTRSASGAGGTTGSRVPRASLGHSTPPEPLTSPLGLRRARERGMTAPTPSPRQARRNLCPSRPKPAPAPRRVRSKGAYGPTPARG